MLNYSSLLDLTTKFLLLKRASRMSSNLSCLRIRSECHLATSDPTTHIEIPTSVLIREAMSWNESETKATFDPLYWSSQMKLSLSYEFALERTLISEMFSISEFKSRFQKFLQSWITFVFVDSSHLLNMPVFKATCLTLEYASPLTSLTVTPA